MTDDNDSRGTLVRMAIDMLADLTATPPLLTVPWPDFPTWATALAAADVLCSLRSDGRVNVTAVERVGDWGSLQVTSIVDVVRDTELPPSWSGRGEWLPVDELERCELFGKAVA
jgi:hypothetical protein